MNRRGFIGRTFGALATAVLAPFIPKPVTTLSAATLRDAETGIAIRFISEWDPATPALTRLGCLLVQPEIINYDSATGEFVRLIS